MIAEYKFRYKKWNKNNQNCYWVGNTDCSNLINQNCDEYIKKLQGSFAFVIENEDNIFLAVDLISSYPLFYSLTDKIIYVSDDASLIAEQIGSELQEENVLEFLKCSYVTEKETLFTDIFTLNPGTYIKINKKDGIIEETQWFHFAYKNPSIKTEKELVIEFDNILNDVFSNLISRLNGRTALIPLSGGCDSRTVAALLKRLHYDNVVCFSYGRVGNFESARSKSIAEHLGFSWIYTEYNAEIWKNLFSSIDYDSFLRFSCRGRGIGCLQALPAILNIKGKGLVPEDAVVIPGHTLDVSMGSHLSSNMLKWKKDDLTSYILHEHYCLRDAQIENGNIEKWEKLISETVAESEIVNQYMQWEYRNRQAKFIANDVRAYEFAGYEYELPFWDSRIQQFVMKLPYDKLYQRKFQYEYTKRIIDQETGIDIDYSVASPAMHNIKEFIKKIPGVNSFLRKRHLHIRSSADTNAAFSWIDDLTYEKYRTGLGDRFNINSIESDDYIKLLKADFQGEK